MKNKFIYALALAAFVLSSCDETTDTIGSSLTDIKDHLKITTDTFLVSSRSIVVDSVLSRSNNGYLGRIKDPETGAIITGNFMAQFYVQENFKLPEYDKIRSKDENGVFADSCEIRLYFNPSFYGDSLATMKVTAYEMSKPMEEGKLYYSNYDPIEEGYVDGNAYKESKVYTLADLNKSIANRSSSKYQPYISIPLNKEYIDKNGKTYKSYGTYLMQRFYENSNDFKNAYSFVHNVCPGFYIKVDNGIGSMASIYSSQISMFFEMETDSAFEGATLFPGTEEVLQKTVISNDKATMQSLAEDNTCTYLRTPAGIFTELTLPVEEIFNGHENDTLNTAKIVLNQLNSKVDSEYALDNAERLLLVQKDSLFSFFEEGKLYDNKRTFVSSSILSSGNSGTTANIYVFNNISSLVTFMHKLKTEGMKSDANWVSNHPDWNKAVVVPVTITTSSSSQYSASTVMAVNNEMGLTSTRLIGGSANPYTPLKISVIYSKFSDK